MVIKIRKAMKKDLEEYLKINVEKFNEEKDKIPSKQSMNKEFERIMSSKDELLIVAEENKKFLGYLHGMIKRNYWGSGGNIEYIFVSKKYRKNGIATKLINEFISIIKNKKGAKVTLMVNLKNKNAERLYKKLGFETTNKVMRKKL